ncbi:MAG: phosphoglycerate dehydrogenase [Acidimicrobiales bacterium]
MARVLVTEKIAESGLEQLRAAGHEVDVRLGLSHEELCAAVVGAEGLLVRSATQVTDEVIVAGSSLLVIGRAGIGLDNIDIEAATRRGVMVANAPQSNIVSAAEHAIALLMAVARNIPQAHAALSSGRWERSAWGGVELSEKTLGILGLGNIGQLVAHRMNAFGMRVIAFDPFVSQERGDQMRVEMCSLEKLLTQSDFVTVHLPRIPETVNLLAAAEFALAKPNMFLVNAARGGIVNEHDLADAVRDGVIAGAAIDVFDVEPTTESPLFELSSVIVTPHLGASTSEAQDKAGITVAEQLLLAFSGEFVPFAVNVSARGDSAVLKPYTVLAERLGSVLAGLVSDAPTSVEVEVNGPIAAEDTSILKLSALKGVLARSSSDPVSYVNAPQLAQERGLEVSEVRNETSRKYVNLLTVRSENHEVSGTLIGPSHLPRIVSVDGVSVVLPLAEHLTLVRNVDTPGIVGVVGSILGDAGINVSDMSLGRADDGDDALMLLATHEAVPTELLAELELATGVHSVRSLIA